MTEETGCLKCFQSTKKSLQDVDTTEFLNHWLKALPRVVHSCEIVTNCY